MLDILEPFVTIGISYEHIKSINIFSVSQLIVLLKCNVYYFIIIVQKL